MRTIHAVSLLRLDSPRSTPTGWNDIIGLNVPAVNVLVEMTGDDLPDWVEVKLESRVPNRLAGPTTLTCPVFWKLPRVGTTRSYFVSRPVSALGSFLDVRTPATLKLATVHRQDGTSDGAFRAAGPWVMRGVGVQPSKLGGDTGNLVAEVPDGRRLLEAGGVEVLEVSVAPLKGWNVRVRQGRVARLIRSPADVFYYSGHGGGDNLRIHTLSGYDNWVSASDLVHAWPRALDLDVFIIAGCSTLEAARREWATLLTVQQGPLRAILGYRMPDELAAEQRRLHQSAHSAPGDDQGGDHIAAAMGKRIAAGSTRVVSDWLEVNRPHQHVGGINAAGMDATGYYWQTVERGEVRVHSMPLHLAV